MILTIESPKVAPYVGAWIETSNLMILLTVHHVAPYVGAWIETDFTSWCRVHSYVAPYVGAWIETPLSHLDDYWYESHPTWVRGLKHTYRKVHHKYKQVAPYVGAWIETELSKCCKTSWTSHPTWVRGLKHLLHVVMNVNVRRTLRGCVDWNMFPNLVGARLSVAPYVGAWIET